MPKYCCVYVSCSQVDRQFYVGLTRDLPARLRAHNDGRVNSAKERMPFELVYCKVVEMRATRRNGRNTLKLPGENVISKTGSDVISRGKASSVTSWELVVRS